MTRRRTAGFDRTAELLGRLLTESYARLSDEDVFASGPRAADPAEMPRLVAEQCLANRALRAARSLLARLERSRPEDERAVARLLADPVPERWRHSVANGNLHRPEVIELLLASASSANASRIGVDAEETSLLVLHLCERLDPDPYPEGLVSDLFCRALALRVEHLIARQRLRAAEIVLLRTQDLLLESSDPLVAQDVGFASALLHWAEGNREAALALLNDLGRLAAVVGDVDRVGELALWGCVLLLELGDAEAAAGLEAQAEDLLGASGTKESWVRVRARHAALRLADAPLRPRDGSPTVH